MKLVIGNKNYSSWSLRPWLLLRHAGMPFEEIHVPLATAEGERLLEKWSPSGRVPVLHDGPLVLWETLAICEYVADRSTTVSLWPDAPERRAIARSISAEMHAGFQALRSNMPMNLRRRVDGFKPDLDTRIDIDRVTQIFENALGESDGPWLFGDYSVADAMYAPVLLRFQTYAIPLPLRSRRYQQTVLGDPHLREWCEAAKRESAVIARCEVADGGAGPQSS